MIAGKRKSISGSKVRKSPRQTEYVSWRRDRDRRSSWWQPQGPLWETLLR